MKKSSEPPLKRPAVAASPGSKKVSAEWYRDYQNESFVHDNEFEETRIHTQSYDHRIGHIRGAILTALLK